MHKKIGIAALSGAFISGALLLLKLATKTDELNTNQLAITSGVLSLVALVSCCYGYRYGFEKNLQHEGENPLMDDIEGSGNFVQQIRESDEGKGQGRN